MLTFYLVRHGMTQGNYAHIIMGQEIDTPLTDHGIENAEYLGQHLKGKQIHQIYASDLGRAFITAHIIAENLHIHFQNFKYGVYRCWYTILTCQYIYLCIIILFHYFSLATT